MTSVARKGKRTETSLTLTKRLPFPVCGPLRSCGSFSCVAWLLLRFLLLLLLVPAHHFHAHVLVVLVQIIAQELVVVVLLLLLPYTVAVLA